MQTVETNRFRLKKEAEKFGFNCTARNLRLQANTGPTKKSDLVQTNDGLCFPVAELQVFLEYLDAFFLFFRSVKKHIDQIKGVLTTSSGA